MLVFHAQSSLTHQPLDICCESGGFGNDSTWTTHKPVGNNDWSRVDCSQCQVLHCRENAHHFALRLTIGFSANPKEA